MREMKDSSIPWVGEIPKDWTNKRIKYLLMARDGGSWGTDPTTYNKGTICMRIADFDFDNGEFAKKPVESLTRRVYTKRQIQKLQLQKNDICIEKSGGGEKTPVGRAVIFNKSYLALFANFMDRLRFDSSKINPVFAEYWFRAWYSCKGSPYYINQTTGIQNINLTLMMSKEKMFFPPVHEQHRITDYLDSKCAKIDSVKKNVEAEIEALKQYKKSVITEAVTKGLDKDVEMKDSGIPWCPRIPKHWVPTNPKALFHQRKERARENDKQLTASQKHGIVFQDDFMKIENQKVVTVAKDFDILKHVEPNDFVISMRSFQGGLEFSELSGCISSAYVMLVPNCNLVYPPFYRWLFKSDKYINAIQSTTNLIRDGQAMRFANFVMVPLFIIPLDEQQRIADYLNKKCSKIDSIIQKKQEMLANLDTYKKSLIYEYVTGKKEVPAV